MSKKKFPGKSFALYNKGMMGQEYLLQERCTELFLPVGTLTMCEKKIPTLLHLMALGPRALIDP